MSFLDGTGASHPGAPTLEYVNHLRERLRATDAQLDIGACEYSPPSLSSIRIEGGNCVLDFTSVPGAAYDLLRAMDVPGVWTPVVTNIPGLDGFTEVVDTNSSGKSQTFYRVRSSL